MISVVDWGSVSRVVVVWALFIVPVYLLVLCV